MSSKEAPEGFRALPVEGFGSHGDFEKLIGPLYVADITKASLRFGLFAAKKHCNFYGVVHGGVFMSLVDSMMGNVVFATLAEGKRVATISVTTDFMGAGKDGDWLEGDASIVRLGRTIAFADARIRIADKLVFFASGKFAITG